ncbi:ABC transporter ATP-binding protein [Magnetospirillum sp. 15-1]|uniref:ABC transporter ATP-binding protein n=1 Tax=Magnetospirillum sp. 15-1 TaxID=1979370 RepID=UPI000BBC975F|nr:ABC transporter ATP-binding protein [Magnetospirillum sp. 15-1]
MGTLVEVIGVSKHFGEGQSRVDALVDISLTLQSGEVVGLVGPSGSGKSTLLNVIGCIIEPSEGQLILDGTPVFDGQKARGDLRRLRLDKIGFIFQFHNLLPFLNSRDNVAVVLELAGRDRNYAQSRANELLTYLEVENRALANPAILSGGEAQRVAIARALANQPRLILADEPTAALDSERAVIAMDLLRKVAREQDAAVLVVSHDEKIFDHFDRMLRIRDGRFEATLNSSAVR